MGNAIRSKLNWRGRHRRRPGSIGRAPSPWLVYGIPWGSVMLASLTPMLPIITSAPLVPPFAIMTLIAWRQARPGLMPIWAGLPLGLWDDLFSGQPLGSGILLFSLTMIALEIIERRLPWRGFVQEWLFASAIIVIYLALAALIAGGGDYRYLLILGPQLFFSLLMFPIVTRIVALLDNIRLLPLWRIA